VPFCWQGEISLFEVKVLRAEFADWYSIPEEGQEGGRVPDEADEIKDVCPCLQGLLAVSMDHWCLRAGAAATATGENTRDACGPRAT
jgi:hypothetical protein